MPYRPKYCCQCGEEIERFEWKIWTSRRFCQFCETEVGHYDWLPRIALGTGIFLSIIGLGNYLAAPERSFSSGPPRPPVGRPFAPPEPVDADGRTPSPVGRAETVAPKQRADPSFGHQKEASVAAGTPDKRTPPGEAVVRQNAADEPVYLCGAETKKGTPCSRRIRGGGRCWQHTGRNAMLSDEKLLVR